MEFGKVDSENVKTIDFALPEDGEQTLKVLNGECISKPDIFIGCAKWGRKEWVGLIYPPKTKEADFLDQYAKHFNSIELNAASYRIPSADLIRKWKEKAADNAVGDFLFCPKFPSTVTHTKRLKAAQHDTAEFINAVTGFEEHLGPCLLQLSESFGVKSFDVLKDYLMSLPKDLSVFVELRNEQWFSDSVIRQGLMGLLTETHKGIVITDVSGRRDVVHMELTVPEVFVRFVGNGSKHKASDFSRIEQWAVRLKLWQQKGLQKIYFFLHQHDELDTPLLAAHTIKVFNEQLGVNIPEVTFQPALFG
ncbi:DUF72 domain-containing protein [Pedobacter sp. PAMC26386]|nr:DUF72 domain-containing protein [Pedobacter sp. PAMC26386]